MLHRCVCARVCSYACVCACVSVLCHSVVASVSVSHPEQQQDLLWIFHSLFSAVTESRLLHSKEHLLRFCSPSSLSLPPPLPLSPSLSLSVCLSVSLHLCLCQLLLQPLLLFLLRSLRVQPKTAVLVVQVTARPALVIVVLETETAKNATLCEGLVEF